MSSDNGARSPSLLNLSPGFFRSPELEDQRTHGAHDDDLGIQMAALEEPLRISRLLTRPPFRERSLASTLRFATERSL